MGTVLGLAGWALALLLAEITVSCLVRTALARLGRGTAPDHPLTLAGFSGSLFLAVVALTAPHPLLPALTAAVVFTVTAAPLANLMRLAAKQDKAGIARQRIFRMLRIMLQDARYLPAKDLRALLSMIRRPRPAEDGTAVRPGPGRLRQVPPVLSDVALGPVPHPASVAADLEGRNVPVHSTWGALAEREGTFEAEDEDDLVAHGEESAAGLLTLADAYYAQAENAAARGLDPGYVAALYDFADSIADSASVAVMTLRRYGDVYTGVREHVDGGGTLMKDADGWFGAGANPEGGQAA